MSSPESDAPIVETFTNARRVAVTRIVDVIAGCFLAAVAVLLLANSGRSSAPGAFVASSVALIAIAALLLVHAMRLQAIVLCCYAERFTNEGMRARNC